MYGIFIYKTHNNIRFPYIMKGKIYHYIFSIMCQIYFDRLIQWMRTFHMRRQMKIIDGAITFNVINGYAFSRLIEKIITLKYLCFMHK